MFISFDQLYMLRKIFLTGRVAKAHRNEVEEAFGNFVSECMKVEVLHTSPYEGRNVNLTLYTKKQYTIDEAKALQFQFFANNNIACIDRDDLRIMLDDYEKTGIITTIDDTFRAFNIAPEDSF